MADVTPQMLIDAPSTEAAVKLLVDVGVPQDQAEQIAALERGEDPGDLVNVDDWPELA